MNYRSYHKNKIGYPFFWNTLYIYRLSLARQLLLVCVIIMLIVAGVFRYKGHADVCRLECIRCYNVII